MRKMLDMLVVVLMVVVTVNLIVYMTREVAKDNVKEQCSTYSGVKLEACIDDMK